LIGISGQIVFHEHADVYKDGYNVVTGHAD
jgi:hypothetical protein